MDRKLFCNGIHEQRSEEPTGPSAQCLASLDERGFTVLAVVCLFYVHDNTVDLTAEPPCQSPPVVSIGFLFLCSLCLQSTGTAGRLLV